MFAKKIGRTPYRSNRRTNFKKSNGQYTHHRPRSRANIYQLYDKYQKLAKEYSTSGDRIQSEYYYQFADHYSRLMSELGIKTNETETVSDQEEKNLISDNKTTINKEVVHNELDKEKSALDKDKSTDEDDSLESVSFIAKPAKKKLTKI